MGSFSSRRIVFILCAILLTTQAALGQPPEEKYCLLEKNIISLISSLQAQTSIIIYELKLKNQGFLKSIFPAERFSFSYNAQLQFPAASLVKVPIMACCFLAAKEKKIDLNEIYTLRKQDKTGGSGILKSLPPGIRYRLIDLIRIMITNSDNTAANVLIRRLGFEYLEKSFQRLGLRNTTLKRGMMDFSARSRGIENYTTAADTAFLLEQMYYKRLIDPDISEKIFQILLAQKIKDRIPKYLPPKTPVAHKTGLEKDVIMDAGIVFSPNADFLIVVAMQGSSRYSSLKKAIADIAKYVYYTYNQPQTTKKAKKHFRGKR